MMSENKDRNKQINIDLSKEEIEGLDEVRGEKSQEDFIKMSMNLLIYRQQNLRAQRGNRPSTKGSRSPLPFFTMDERGEVKEF